MHLIDIIKGSVNKNLVNLYYIFKQWASLSGVTLRYIPTYMVNLVVAGAT